MRITNKSSRRASARLIFTVPPMNERVKTRLGLKWLLLCIALVSSGASAQTPSPAISSPQKYNLDLVYIFEGKTPEFIFVVGNSGFRSVSTLKDFLGGLPAGSELTWAPGCKRMGGEPLLSSESEMNNFRKFLEERGIKFTLVPSG